MSVHYFWNLIFLLQSMYVIENKLIFEGTITCNIIGQLIIFSSGGGIQHSILQWVVANMLTLTNNSCEINVAISQETRKQPSSRLTNTTFG